MTVGYGDITPANPLEIYYVTISVFLGCGLFAFYINKMGLILGLLN